MLLAGDVGGTNTRLGLFTAASPRPDPVEIRTYETGDFPTLQSMLAAFLADAGASPSSIEAAAFGGAGPVVHGCAALTNAAWQVDARVVADSLRLPAVRLLNDLLAMAHAVPVLAAAERRTLQEGEENPHGNVALIAPGTGLGEALLVNTGGVFVPSPSEGGHADFAARTAREVGLLAFLTEQFGRADYERVISGPGLVHLHRFVHGWPCAAVDRDAPDAAAQVSAIPVHVIVHPDPGLLGAAVAAVQ